MGEKQVFQPLTREDKVTVVLYRVGIVLSTLIVVGMAGLPVLARGKILPLWYSDALIYGLYASVALSVFFIHLYIGKLKEYLKVLYYVALGCLAALLYIGEGSVSASLETKQAAALLLLPLSGCLGFVTAKEAFCFKLIEGYLLAMIMPFYLLLVAGGLLSGAAALSGLGLIAALLVLFTLRKTLMPIAYDIGDKTAYQ